MKKLVCLALFFAALPAAIFAQKNFACGHDALLQAALADTVFAQKQAELDSQARRFFEKKPEARRGSAATTVPVVVHILHNGGAENIPDAQVLAAIQHLNDAFANAGWYAQNGTGAASSIQFCLATRDPAGNATSGITRTKTALTELVAEANDLAAKGLSRWEPRRYLNIWVVRSICFQSLGCDISAYAVGPALHGTNSDGVVIEHPFLGAKPELSTVLAHEVGHYFGLYHTFAGGCGNANCLTDGDQVCDTPPDQSTAPVPCDLTVNTCTTDSQSGFSTDQPDPATNFMDYGNVACFHDFTAGQVARMDFFLNQARQSLLASDGCEQPCPVPVAAAFFPGDTAIFVGTTLNFQNQSQHAASYVWQQNGQPFSAETNPALAFQQEGIFTISLTASGANPALCPPQTATATVQVICPVIADFQADMLETTLGGTVNFTNLSQNFTTLNWTVGGLPQGANLPSFTFPAAGVFPVKLTASNGLCSRSKTLSIFVQDSCREQTWQLRFGAPGNDEAGRATISLSNGALLLGGDGTVPGAGREALLLRADANGNATWALRLGSAANDEFLTDLAPLGDGSFVAALSSGGQPVLARFSGTGTLIWQRKMLARGQIRRIRPQSDGALALAGWLENAADTTAFFAKMSPQGNLIWARNWRGAGAFFGQDIAPLAGGDYIAAGYLLPKNGAVPDGMALKIGPTGDLELARRAAGTPFYAAQEANGTYYFAGEKARPSLLAPLDTLTCGWIYGLSETAFFEPNPQAITTHVACATDGKKAAFSRMEWSSVSEFWLAMDNAGGAASVLNLPSSFVGTLRQFPAFGAAQTQGIGFVSTRPMFVGQATDAAGTSDIFWAKGGAFGMAGACPQGAAGLLEDYPDAPPPPFEPLSVATNPVFQASDLVAQPHFLPKSAPCEAACAESFCKTSFAKYMGKSNWREGITAVVPAPDGSFFCAGFKNDSSLLLQIAPDGTVIWARILLFSKQFERITDLMLDSEGWLVGAGRSNVTALIFNGFAFRYNPQTHQTQWVSRSPSGQNLRFTSLAEIAPGGHFRLSATRRSGSAPNFSEQPEWLELARNTGAVVPGGAARQYVSAARPTAFFQKIERVGDGWYAYGGLGLTPPMPLDSPRALLARLGEDGAVLWAVAPSASQNWALSEITDVAGGGDSLLVALPFGTAGNEGENLLLCLNAADGSLRWQRGLRVRQLNPSSGTQLVFTAHSIVEILPRPGALYLRSTAGTGNGLGLLKTDGLGRPIWARAHQLGLLGTPGARLMAERDETLFVLGEATYFSGLSEVIFVRLDATTGEMGEPGCVEIAPLEASPLTVSFSLENIDLQALAAPMSVEAGAALPKNFTLANPRYRCASPCTERCDNGQDDDYNGRPDCFDPACACTDCEGQSGRLWYFGLGAGLDFGTEPPQPIFDGQLSTAAATAVACDPMGNLLFYTDGQRVFDRNHQVMPNGTGLGGSGGAQQCLAFPIRGLDEFAIATISGPNSSGESFYSKVDMTARDFLGEISATTKKVPLIADDLTAKIAATSCKTGTWLVMKVGTGNEWRAVFFSAGTISSSEKISKLGTPTNENGLDNTTGQVKFSGDGRTLANALPGTGGFELFDFDLSEGGLTNARRVVLPGLDGAAGLEFSPNDRYLYVSTRRPPSRVWQFDLLAGDATAIAESRVLVAESPIFGTFSLMQLARNGKIYVSNNPNNASTGSLHAVHRPDAAGTACQFQTEAQSLGGKKAFFGLPTFTRQAVWPKTQAKINGPDSICGVPTRAIFRAHGATCDALTVWGVANLASTFTPLDNHAVEVLFEQTGTALVTVSLATDCGIVRDTLRVVVAAGSAPMLDLGPDLVLCENGVVKLSAGAGFARYLWNDGTTDSALTASFTGKYSVTAWDACGNPQRDTLEIRLSPNGKLSLGTDRKICRTEGAEFTRPAGFTTWQWSPSQPIAGCDTCATLRVFPQKTTLFTVVGTGADGCLSTDTVLVALDTARLAVDTFVCENERLAFLGAWLPADTTAIFPLLTAGGCDSILTLTTMPLAQVSFDLPPDTTLKLGDTLRLSIAPSGLAPFDFLWKISPDGSPAALSCTDCSAPDFWAFRSSALYLQILSANGCSTADSLKIKVLDVCDIAAPTAFTPDGDGTNDTFYLLADPCARRVVSLRIFTRWGEEVFSRQDFPANTRALGWDGRTKNGEPMPSDVLVWLAELELYNGARVSKKGEVTLLR